jgi:hypothetical protein
LGTGAGIIFKGSGFYTTDYRSHSYQEGVKKETPATSASEKSGEAKKASEKAATSTITPADKPKKESAA